MIINKDKARIEIEFDPETMEYSMTTSRIKVEHLTGILSHIIERIDGDDLGPDIEKTDGFGNPAN